MLNRLQYKFMAVAVLGLTGRMFAAAEGTVGTYAYTVKGRDSKKVGELNGWLNSHSLVTFDRTILDADTPHAGIKDTSRDDILNRTVPFFFYDNGSVIYRQHQSVAVRRDIVKNIAGRWLLLSAATTHEAHASLVALAGSARDISAKDAAKALKGNGITCVVINAEEFKAMAERELADRHKRVIDLPSISVDRGPETSAPRQPRVPEDRGFEFCSMQ